MKQMWALNINHAQKYRAITIPIFYISMALAPVQYLGAEVCIAELKSLKKSKQDCENLAGASVGAMTLGGIFLGPFGGLIGLIPGLPAQHNCETVLPNKQRVYDECLIKTKSAELDALKKQQEIAKQEKQKSKNLKSINTLADKALEFANDAYDLHKRAVSEKYSQAGYDLHNEQLHLILEEHFTNAAVLIKEHRAEVDTLRDRLIETAEMPDSQAFQSLNNDLAESLESLLDKVSV